MAVPVEAKAPPKPPPETASIEVEVEVAGPEPMTEAVPKPLGEDVPAEAEAVPEDPVSIKAWQDSASAKPAPAPAIPASAPARSAPAQAQSATVPVRPAPPPARPAAVEVESNPGGQRRGPSRREKRRLLSHLVVGSSCCAPFSVTPALRSRLATPVPCFHQSDWLHVCHQRSYLSDCFAEHHSYD